MTQQGGTLHTGIIGAGLMGRWHADAVKTAGGRVIAVIDREGVAARRLAAGVGGRAYDSLDSALNAARVDVLHICTPLETHFTLADAALRSGLHVVVEKPLTTHAAETEALYAVAQSAGRLLIPVHQFPFQEGAIHAAQRLETIGRIIGMEARFYSAGAEMGKGQADQIVADVIPHPLSLMRLFLRASLPTEWKVFRPAEGELRAYSDSAEPSISLMITVSMSARPTLAWFTLIGTEGTLHLDLFHGYSFREPGTVSRARKILRPFDTSPRMFTTAAVNLARRAIRRDVAYPGLRTLIGAFYQAIRTDASPPITLDAALEIARVRDTILSWHTFQRQYKERQAT